MIGLSGIKNLNIYLKEYKNATFIIVVSVINCLTGILGIVLGILTIIEIQKPEVSALFEANKINWPKVDFEYQNTEIAENYYQQPILDQILKEYGKTLEDTYIQFPVAALEGLDNLAALSNSSFEDALSI